jgi:hypothetical protein
MESYGGAASPAPSSTISRTARRSLSDQLVYPGRITQPPRTEVRIDRDFARSMLMMSVQQMDMNTGETRAHTFEMDERAARHLAEQLNDFNPTLRRHRETEQAHSEARAELRNIVNQLEEVRSHNTTLMDVNTEQARQIRWLERELRDANQERRAAV